MNVTASELTRALGGMSNLQNLTLVCLYQHRLLSTGQLRRLLLPATPHTVYLRQLLRDLRQRGLVGSIPGPGRAHQSLWFATAEGAAQAELSRQVTPRDYRMTAETAAGPLQQHTLAVNEVGTLFVETARAHGHECGPLDWTHEAAHRMRDGSARRADHEYLIADAVLHYVVVRPDRRIMTRMCIELDRCTMTVARLADKIASYGRYHQYVPGAETPAPRPAGTAALPAWRYRYPRFPGVLVILTGANRSSMRTRIEDLRALCAEDPWLRRAAPNVGVGATTLDQLRASGPLQKIFTPILGPDPSPVDLSLRL